MLKKGWRPPKWDNPYNFSFEKKAIPNYEIQSRCFEEGADEILKTLMGKPLYRRTNKPSPFDFEEVK